MSGPRIQCIHHLRLIVWFSHSNIRISRFNIYISIFTISEKYIFVAFGENKKFTNVEKKTVISPLGREPWELQLLRRLQEGKYIPYTEKDPKLLTELLARVKVGVGWVMLRRVSHGSSFNIPGKVTAGSWPWRWMVQMIFPCDWVDFFRLHLNFQGCTTELMKQKWLLEKKVVCQTKFLFWWWRVVCFMVHLMEKGKTCGGNSHQNTCLY